MTGYKENLSKVVEKESHLRVVLGYDANYTMKVFGSTSLQLESNDGIYVLGMCCSCNIFPKFLKKIGPSF